MDIVGLDSGMLSGGHANSARGRWDSDDEAEWTIYITNDDCPDYTWGFVEEQTRQNLADVAAGHLDQMNRTDGDAWENQDRFNMCITLEASCLASRYPHRKDELIRRVKEGRIFVSAYLCNSLWGFQSFESAIRTFYPARRLELEWGVPMEVAEHIECPSLPWGTASILAGCGIRWLSVPFLNVDCTFGQLKNPPVFIYQGPDGAELRVMMDLWACDRWQYVQGWRGILSDPSNIAAHWLPRYQGLGDGYPLKAALASGTHGDTKPWSGGEASRFADAIRTHNSNPQRPARLVNALVSDYCRAVDEAQSRKPFLETLRGCFGHSWDLWPVSLAKYAAEMRANGELFMAAESLVAISSLERPELSEGPRVVRERAEWCWAMLSDHAWNGTDPDNCRLNAELRRHWNAELNEISVALLKQVSLVRPWGPREKSDEQRVTVFNALSFPRTDLVRLDSSVGIGGLADAGMAVSTQVLEEEGRPTLYALLGQIPAFSTKTLNATAEAEQTAPGSLRATATELESPSTVWWWTPRPAASADWSTGPVGRS